LHRIPSALCSKFAEDAAFVNASVEKLRAWADFSSLAVRVALRTEDKKIQAILTGFTTAEARRPAPNG